MPDLHKNFAVSTLANAPGTGGTSFVVSSGEGSRFPTPPFNATVCPAGVQANPSNSEIVRVTAIASDTLTVTRNANFLTGDADKGGTAQNVAVGWQIFAGITAKTLWDIETPQAGARKLGSMTFFGHSYLAGTTQLDSGVSNVYQESVASKLMAMFNVHEHNTIHLAQAASRLCSPTNKDSSSAFGGWAGALQFFWPHNSTAINPQNDVVYADPVVASMNGALTIVHGHNDIFQIGGVGLYNNAQTFNGGQYNDTVASRTTATAKQALRTILSRFRAGVVHAATYPAGGGALAYDGSTERGQVTFGTGTWVGITASTTKNSGAGYQSTTDFTAPNGAFTITLPTNFTGGVVTVCLIGQASGCGYLTSTAAAGSSTLAISNRSAFPQSGRFPITVLADGTNAAEDLLVTASGSGAGNFTVQTAGAGTTAVQHLSGATVVGNKLAHRVNWSGTATLETGSGVGQSSDGTMANVVTNDGTAITYVSGQGAFGSEVSVVMRFRCTSAAAGQTIIGTTANAFANDTGASVQFDSWWIEDSEPPPAVMTNIQDFMCANSLLSNGWQRIRSTYIPNWNSMLASLATEFTDGFVRVADVWTAWNQRGGTMTASDGTSGINNTDVTTSIRFTPTLSTFTPKKGMAFSFGGFAPETVLVATTPAYVGPYWTFDITRGALGTSANKQAHSANDWMGAADWMHPDGIHLNTMGHAVFAEKIYQEFAAMPVPAAYQIAQVVGNWSQGSQLISMGLMDDGYLYQPASGLTLAALNTGGTALNDQWATPIYIPKLCVAIAIGLQHGTAGTTGVMRMGIYMSDRTMTRPGRLVVDGGTVTTASTNEALQVTIYQVLRPGWYWLSGVQQTAIAGGTRNFNALGLPFPSLMAAATFGAANVSVLGYKQTGITGALADWSSTYTVQTAGGTIPRMFLRLRTMNYA